MRRNRKIIILASCSVLLTIIVVILRMPKGYTPVAPTQYDSAALKATIVVPTLDTPIPEGKSAVWCAAFEIAWKQAEKDIFKGPCLPQNGKETAARLTASSISEADFAPASVFAAAGDPKSVQQKLNAEFPQKFPGRSVPQLTEQDGILSYSAVNLSVPFQIPFFENDKPLLFTDANGTKTAVDSFGIRDKDDYAYYKLRDQVGVLFAKHGKQYELLEFALDLCRSSGPYQIIVAVIPRHATLSAAMNYVRIGPKASEEDKYSTHEFGPNDAMLIPNQTWAITHHFKDLTGPMLNPGFEKTPLVDAFQLLQFKLDRSGAELNAEAKVLVLPIPSYYYVDRPFLLYIQKRGAANPIFAAWIDNAELLQKR